MKILVVDDEPTIRSNLKRLLVLEGHQVVEAENGRSALTAMETDLPELVFTDVRMPELDGYDLCRAIKTNEDFKIVPVIFVSGVESIEARIEAFSAGGEDFIVKPFQVQEVLRKVGSAARILSESRELKQQASNAQSAAFVAMKWAAEIGLVLDFVRKSIACNDLPSLATLIRSSASQFGLDALVEIRGAGETLCLSGKGRDIPLDISVMGHARMQGRIFEFQSRCAFNYDSVSILIANMPRDDEERCGRLRDHIALLAEAADARNIVLTLEVHKNTHEHGIAQALTAAEAAVKAVSAVQRDTQKNIETEMAKLQENLARVFVGCGLREAQEESIVAVISEHIEEMVVLVNASRQAAAELDRVTSILDELARGSRRA